MTEQWRPTRDFFEQDIRAAQLRNLCLNAIDNTLDVIRGDGKNVEAIEQLFDVNSQLHEAGIEPGMQLTQTKKGLNLKMIPLYVQNG
jgi:hypothetical protein